MYKDRFVFSQLMDFFPKNEFNKCVRRYNGNHRAKTFTCLDQYMAMAFAQLTGRESLRDIETCLRVLHPCLYHVGIRGNISRSTLADANEKRNWRIYAELASILIQRARELYAQESFGVELNQTTYALDSTTIDLCLTLFPWAQFRKRKSAVKMHTLLDLKGSIPCFIHISSGKVHDVNVLDILPLEAGAFYIMDKAYTDFERLFNFTKSMAYFITRAKNNLVFIRCNYRQIDKATGVRSDQTIRLKSPKSSQLYPGHLRRITFYDADTNKMFVFLTNNFILDALTIALLYKCRWKIELFFKWIKQHLRIKAFFGTSVNAVKTQIWIAVCVYVLVAIIKKRLGLEDSLYTILQILSVSLFEKTLILQAFSKDEDNDETGSLCNQLELFNL